MINEMKSFKAPPALVAFVLSAVCLLFGEKEDWDSAKKVMGKMNFLDELIEFKVETILDKTWNKLRKNYLSSPDFTKEKVQGVSLAATSLLEWVIAVEKFAGVKKVVGPKEIALREAESKLK
jgi:dynein heavy chain